MVQVVMALGLEKKILEAVAELKDTLAQALDKKASGAKDLENKIAGLENVTTAEIRQLQEQLKKMQQSQDLRALEQAARVLRG